MIVEYKYRLVNGGRRGFYQAEREDFIKFWQRRPPLVWCCVVAGRKAYWWSPRRGWRATSVAFCRSC